MSPSGIVQPGPSVTPEQVTIEGTIESVSAPSTLVVSGRTITLRSDAVIRAGATQVAFADLRAGAQAKVTAVSDGNTLSGSLVELSGDIGNPVQLRGVIAELSRNGSAFQFKIGDQVVQGDGASEVLDGSRVTDSSPLRNGQSVDVDALQRAGHLYGKRITLREDSGSGSGSDSGSGSGSGGGSSPSSPSPAPAPAPEQITVNGVLGPVVGVCPVLTFPLSGRIIITDNNTAYVGGSCQALVVGGSAQVEGTSNGNTVIAREITIQ